MGVGDSNSGLHACTAGAFLSQPHLNPAIMGTWEHWAYGSGVLGLVLVESSPPASSYPAGLSWQGRGLWDVFRSGC